MTMLEQRLGPWMIPRLPVDQWVIGTFGLETKTEQLNHMFVEDGENYGGFDTASLRHTLERAGFFDIEQVVRREGRFPGGTADLEMHGLHSFFMEAIR